MFRGMVASFVCAAIMVLLTNVFLTRFVFKRIILAMDILTYGVRQIRDGNLDYRIEYVANDEFTPVCDDFNQMAGRLLVARETKRRDEQSRKELIAGISHDLRTPLTSIKAYVEGLEQGVASTPDARKRYVSTIKNKTLDLENVIEKLFLFSKLDTGEFPYRIERVDLGVVVSEIVSGISEEYFERGLDIALSCEDIPVFVNIDAIQMRNVLINIFENSLKYKEKERGRLAVNVAREADEAVLILSDDGPGVPDEALPKLFDLFYRLDGSRSNPSRGSGLGLAIVAKMVTRFSGKIEAKNQNSGGLSIKIRLPAV
jgi:signal transduction histidine kinase